MKKITFNLITLLSLSLFSCKKDQILNNQDIVPASTSKQVVFNIDDNEIGIRTPENNKTLLGRLRQNPFDIRMLSTARQSLYLNSVSTPSNSVIPTTDLYVKFTPTTLEHIKLLDDTDENFYDYPLEYEIINMGNYYQEMTSVDDLPILYAIVPYNFQFPIVPYEVLSHLNLSYSKKDPLLLAESFRLTGNQEDIQPFIVGFGGLNKDDMDGDVQARIPPEPDCPPGYYAVLYIDESEKPFKYRWECEPIPPSEPNLNGCGCEVTQNRRHPGGCIRVEDTELSNNNNIMTFMPVRRVKVIAKDTWFGESETWTNDNGCWQILEEFRNNAWIWVKFKNDRCKIRGAGAGIGAVWEWLTPVKDYIGKLEGPTFNNTVTNYRMWGDQGSNAHIFWGAATVNNAVHEFHDYAAQDGINPPKDNLDIYIGRNHRSGAAYMGSQYRLAANLNGALTSFLLWTITAAFLPEVYIGININTSDRQKRLAYHEIAHASHYSQVGLAYWDELVKAEARAILSGGNDESHGNSTSPDAGRIALCESWAEHIGMSYAHRSYPLVTQTSIGITWERWLEETWNETTNHIPIGLYHDLADNSNDVNQACDQDGNGCAIIDDQVRGFTNQQMFSCLTNDITDPDAFIVRLIANHLAATPNTAIQVNNLFSQY